MTRVRRLSDRFAEAAESCPGLPQLRELMHDVTAELGFDYFALLDHASLATAGDRFVRVDNYPQAWVEEMVALGYAPDDPVHLASRRTNMGFGWCDLERLIRVDRRQLRILARGRRYDIGSGLTVPANVPGEPSASCSFAMRCGADLPLARLHCAELVGAHALRAARRLRPKRQRPRPHLSRRERQCLALVAAGKTDWEIATILGLSAETARQYVKRARAAYDVVSRTQLAVHGLHDAWISFEDVLLPDAGARRSETNGDST